jgi:UDP-N-acetylmuramate: L-alanyl-gamma-D-glutamyl-meso-diaminopimelate ligase
VFEPRSNTTRRNVFQKHLVECLSGADAVVISEVARLEQLRPEERLDPGRLLGDLRAMGKPSAYLPSVDAIVDHLMESVVERDVVCVFSNGGFGGIHDKLLARLAVRATG